MEYLKSNCINMRPAFCTGNCGESVKKGPNGNYFITMGHPGFDSTTNNERGYETEEKAKEAIKYYMNKAK